MRGPVVVGVLTAASALAAAGVEPASRPPAFPGAEGFGAQAQGGRGGRVIYVTNLHDSGPGSLRAACEEKGPRTILFKVSGVIELQSKLVVRDPHVTIAGQTAPGDGVCLKNCSFNVNTHDVVVRFLRFRVGDRLKKEFDSVSITESENVIFDHCSASWSIDETLSPTRSKSVTVQWCLITESLDNSCHHKGPHGYGSLITGSEGGMTFHHNLYAHHRSRSPRPGAPPGTEGMVLDFRNNVIYDWGDKAGYSAETPVRMNYVGNYLKPGPSTKQSARQAAFWPGSERTRICMIANVLEGYAEAIRENGLLLRPGGSFPRDRRVQDVLEERLFPGPLVRTELPDMAFERVLVFAGATLPRRDPVDERLLGQVRAGTGKIIDSQDQVGGWPVYASLEAPPDTDGDGLPDAWEREHGLNPQDPADGARDSGDGYTNLEKYLNYLATRMAPAR
jgi:pectate lyase